MSQPLQGHAHDVDVTELSQRPAIILLKNTLGIAAGCGYDSPYRGMAYESDICLVSNAVSDDEQFIDSTDYYKYTYATDALGFKYIMDV